MTFEPHRHIGHKENTHIDFYFYVQTYVSMRLCGKNQAPYIQPADDNQFMLIASYSKRIGHPVPDQYPVQLNTNAAFVNDTVLFNFINKQPFLFLSENRNVNTSTQFDSSHLRIIESGPGYTKCLVKTDKSVWLNFLQND